MVMCDHVTWSTRYCGFSRRTCDCLLRDIQKGMPTVYTVVHMKRSVCDCGHTFTSKKRKARCTSLTSLTQTTVGDPENAMKCRKALLSEEELL